MPTLRPHRSPSGVRSLSHVLAVYGALLSVVAPAQAEGTAQLNATQALRAGTVLYVDIVDAAQESITWEGAGTLAVSAPDGTPVATLSSGQASGSLAGYGVGAYEAVVDADQVVFQTWDASVLGQTTPGGRLFSYDWRFNAGAFSEERATNASFYAIVPGGGSGQSSVIELQLNGLAGFVYNVNANRIGVDGSNAGRSVGMSGNSVSPEFPIYISPPTASSYSASSPDVFGFAFVGGASQSPDGVAMDPCNQLVPGGSTGTFQFTTNTVGTRHLLCDIDGDGEFNAVGGGDLLLVGTTVEGLNTIPWDGMVDGETVATGTYTCQLRMNVGEFHYVGADIETSYPGMRMYEVHADETRSPLTMYWNDSAVQPAAQPMPNGQPGLEGSGNNGVFSDAYDVAAQPNVNARAWGNWNSGGKGNQGYLDTFTWLATTQSTEIEVTAVDPTVDTDGDGAGDFEETCVFGTDPGNPDTDADGVNDGDQYGGGASSGGGNGLESNGGLASRLARRAIRRSRQTAAPPPSFRASSTLQALAPVAGTLGKTSTDATPWDLPELTNASDVFGRDYFDAAGIRVGGVLLIETVGDNYDHSKVVCDRSKGATMTRIGMSRVGIHEIVRATLNRPDERLSDRTASFTIHEQHTATSAGVFSYWLPSEYPVPAPDAKVTRVQVWSSVPGGEIRLAREVLERARVAHGTLSVPGDEALWTDEAMVDGQAPAAPLATSHLPSHFFRRGVALGDTVRLDLETVFEHEGDDLALRVVGLAEDATHEFVLDIPLERDSLGREVEVEVGRVLDVTVELLRNGEVQDQLWLSDGAWASYDDSLWGGSTEVTFSRQDCRPRAGQGALALAGCARVEATVPDEAGFAGVARHLARPLVLTPYRSLSAHVQSDVPFELCAQTVDGLVYCTPAAPTHGRVTVGLSTLSDASGDPLPGDARITLITFSSEGAGSVAMEVAGLTLSESPAPKPASSGEASAGCACQSGAPGTPRWFWVVLPLLGLLVVRRR